MSTATSKTWVARCECYKGHNSSSGRCTARNVSDGVTQPGGAVFCPDCDKQHGVKVAIVNGRGFDLIPAESPDNAHGQQYNVTYREHGEIVGRTLRTFGYADVLGIIHHWCVEGVQTC